MKLVNTNVQTMNAMDLWMNSFRRELIALHILHHSSKRYIDHFTKELLSTFALQFIAKMGFAVQIIVSNKSINHYVFSKPLSYRNVDICTFIHHK